MNYGSLVVSTTILLEAGIYIYSEYTLYKYPIYAEELPYSSGTIYDSQHIGNYSPCHINWWHELDNILLFCCWFYYSSSICIMYIISVSSIFLKIRYCFQKGCCVLCRKISWICCIMSISRGVNNLKRNVSQRIFRRNGFMGTYFPKNWKIIWLFWMWIYSPKTRRFTS